MYSTLPFKTYTAIDSGLIQTLRCSDAYRVFVLSLITDRKELTTDTTIKQLSSIIGESEHNYQGGKRSISFNDKLRATKKIELSSVRIANKNRTVYKFLPLVIGNYIRVNRILYDEYNGKLPIELLGFILKLFSVANPHSYTISKSMRELSRLIHMSNKTINEYLNRLVSEGLIEQKQDGWHLNVKGLIIDKPRAKKISEMKTIMDNWLDSWERKNKDNEKMPRCLKVYKYYREKNFENVNDEYSLLKNLICGLTRTPTLIVDISYPDIVL